MSGFASVLTLSFDVLLVPFRDLPPVWGIAAVALLTAVFILLVYRFVSNQEAIQREKKRIQGHFLGIYLFQDSAREIFRSLLRLLLAIARYLAWSLPPLLIVIVPVLLACVQLDLRYGRRGLEPGERANVGVRWSGGVDPQVVLQASPDVIVETPPLRISRPGETDWRVKAERSGLHTLRFTANNAAGSWWHMLIAEPGAWRIQPEKVKPSWANYLLLPGDEYLLDSSPIDAIFVGYPSRRIDVFGLRLHWAVVYFALAVLFGFLLKRPLKVEF